MIVFNVSLGTFSAAKSSTYTVVAASISTQQQTEFLEMRWRKLLSKYGAATFDYQNFEQKTGEFSKWRKNKHKDFAKVINTITGRYNLFMVTVGIEQDVFVQARKSLKTLSEHRLDSKFEMCLRYIVYLVGERLNKITSKYRIAIIVEDGPLASIASQFIRRVGEEKGLEWKPAEHLSKIASITIMPKGDIHSLESLNQAANVAQDQIMSGRFKTQRGHVRVQLDTELLRKWYVNTQSNTGHRKTFSRGRSRKRQLATKIEKTI